MVYGAVAVGAGVPLALGILLALRSAQRRIAWLLLAHGVSVGLLLGASRTTGTGTSAQALDQLAQGGWILLFLWLVLVAYLVPDGHLLSAGWRSWVGAGVVGAVLFVVGAAGDADSFREEHPGQDPPLGALPQPLADVLGVVGLALVVLLFIGSAIAVGARLKSAVGVVRTQLLWLVWGAVAVPLGLMVGWTNHFLLGDHDWLTYAALTVVAVALPSVIAIAVLRHQLFDIQVVLSRTLTYAALMVGLVVVYALVLFAAERVGGTSTLGGLLAVGVVAVAVSPAHSWLRRRIERAVYGYRSDPHRALRLLADRAEAAHAETLSASITDAVAEALRVEKVWVDTGNAIHEEHVVRVPLRHRGQELGDLALEVPPGRRLSLADMSLLDDLARYAAVLVKASQAGDQLRVSRSRIVAGREEERRRLRRDLHDGIGPSLAAIVLMLNAAGSRTDSTERSALLDEARAEAKDAIAEVRRLVDDLRPAAIDEVGLLGAIRQRAMGLSGELAIEVTGPTALPALPAAVEVAAYRIASEAMTNVTRHSGASRCRVTIAVNGSLELTIADNGHGVEQPIHGGLGWTSMRERAAELGGTCTISSRTPNEGLIVHAILPLHDTPHQPADIKAER